MACTAPNSKVFDSILVSKLPKGLIQELKQKLLRHFGGYGTVLRISCTSKNNEYTALLQFSSVEEAVKAQKDGTVLENNVMNIRLSDKRPLTKLLTTWPLPLRPSPSVSSANVSNSNSTSLNLKPSVQQNLKSYFCPRPSVTKVNNTTATNQSILNETLRVRVISPNQGSSPVTSGHENFTPTPTTPISVVSTESKPNTCVKIEVYEGPSRANISSPVSSLTSSKSLTELRPLNGHATLRPSRSLREILSLDTSQMKVVAVVNASDALACQYFAGGNRYPFPLSMMFGRTPGSVIMPVGSIMQKIKPGMEISDSTLSATWASIMFAATKEIITTQAKKTLKQEKILNNIIPNCYDQIEVLAIQEIIADFAEEEISIESDIMIVCEDAIDDIISSVCVQILKEDTDAEIKSLKFISTATQSAYKKIENKTVKKIIREEAFLTLHCTEVVEDFLEAVDFEREVKRIAKDAVKCFRKCSKLYNGNENVCKFELTSEEFDNLCQVHCSEAVEALLESDYFLRCVKVIAQEARRSIENYDESSRLNSKSSVLSQLRRSLANPFSKQQNDIATKAAFQQRALSSPNVYIQLNDGQKQDQSISIHSSEDQQQNTNRESGVFSFASLRNFKRKASEWMFNGFKRQKRETE